MVGKNLIKGLSYNYDVLAPSRVELDLLSINMVNDYLYQKKPELIIHCAGHVGGIQANVNNPLEFLDLNLVMGQNIIKSAYQQGIKYFLNLSSSCIYSPNSNEPIEEDSLLKNGVEKTNEGYALAKIVLLKYCEYINKKDKGYFYKTIVPSNLYGDYDKFHPINSHLIPAIILKTYNAIKNDELEIEIWGDGTAKREFMYVKDLVDFIDFYIKDFKNRPSLVNIGVDEDYTIDQYYKVIGKIMGYKGNYIYNTKKPVGMKRKKVNISKLKDLGWKSQTTLEEGIIKTKKYFYENEV